MVVPRFLLSLAGGLLVQVSLATAANIIDLDHSVKRDSPSQVPSGRAALLRPAIDLDVNVYDYATLTPRLDHRFYYATFDRSTFRIQQAWVNYTFHYPLVALDHTAYIKSTKCSGSGGRQMLVQFSNLKAYNAGMDWGKKMPMILSGYWHDGCKPADADAERYFAMATSVQQGPGANAARYAVRFMTVAEVAKDMEINIGAPGGVNSNGTSLPSPTTTSIPVHATSTSSTRPSTSSTSTTSLATPAPSSTITPSTTVTPSSTVVPSLTTSSPQPAQTPGQDDDDDDDDDHDPDDDPSPTFTAKPPSIPVTPADTTLEDFDAHLDDVIGYFKDFGDAFEQQVFPSSVTPAGKRALGREKRALNFLKKVVQAATKAVVQVVTKPLQVAKAVANAAFTVASLPLKAVSTVLNKIVPPIALTPINTKWRWTLPPQSYQVQHQVKSPFGKAIRFFKYGTLQKSSSGKVKQGGKLTTSAQVGMAAYCVNCQIQGQFQVTGTLKVQPIGLLVQQAQIKMTGPMTLSAAIGVEFWGNLNMKLNQNVFSVPISGIKIPGILEVGPRFEANVISTLAVGVDGTILIGQTSKWPDSFTILLDLLNPAASSVSNYDHTTTPVMKLGAAFSISIGQAIQIGFPLKLSFFGGKLDLSAGLYAKAGTRNVIEYRTGDINVARDVQPLTIDERAYDSESVTDSTDVAMYHNNLAPRARKGVKNSKDCPVGLLVAVYADRSVFFQAKMIGAKTIWSKSEALALWCSSDELPGTGPSPTCSGKSNGDNFKLANGAQYKIQCGVAFFGSDIVYPNANSFDECLDLCEQYSAQNNGGCQSISWVPQEPDAVKAGWKACSLKSAVPAASPWVKWEVDSAVRVSGGETCRGLAAVPYTAGNGKQFNIECNTDRVNNDVARLDNIGTFQRCVETCSTDGRCVAVAWAPGQQYCYLKNNVGTASTPPSYYEVMTAVLLSSGSQRRDAINPDDDPDADADSFQGYDLPVPSAEEVPSPDPGFAESFTQSSFAQLDSAPDVTADNAASYDGTSTEVEDATPPDDPTASIDSSITVPDASGITRIQTADGSSFGFSTGGGNLMVQLASNDTTSAGSGGLDTGSFFQTTSTDPSASIYADYTGRMIHVYEDELVEYGVSRLRFSLQEKIPVTSIFVTLAPLGSISPRAGGQSNTLVAINTKGVIYYLTACIYKSNPAFAKVFVMKDKDYGMQALQSDALQKVVTGAPVQSCSMIALQSKPL